MVVVGPVPSATLATSFPADLLQRTDGSSRVLRDFEFLGAAIGSDSYMHSHTEARATRAAELLDAIAELEDPQVSMRLLRACTGYARVVHSLHCNLPQYQHVTLQTFDTMMRCCFAGFTGIHPTAEQWHQAELGLAQAGLRLRSAAVHAPAACLASLGASLSTCSELDRSFIAGPVVAVKLQLTTGHRGQETTTRREKTTTGDSRGQGTAGELVVVRSRSRSKSSLLLGQNAAE